MAINTTPAPGSSLLSSHGAGLTPLARGLTLLVPLVLLTFNLGGAPLFNVDEGAFSEATREMFERGDFLSTWLNGAPRFDKPILIYWFQAVFFWLLGPSEWAFRLPSAIAAALWCHAIAVFSAPRLGRNAAILACGIAATSFGVFVIGRAATADALLNLLVTLTLFDVWRTLEARASGAQAANSKLAATPLRRAYFWIALGVLTKGPVAILIPVAVVFLYSLIGLGGVPLRQRIVDGLRLFFEPIGWLIFLVVAVPWYAAALAIHGRAFIDGFIMKHNVERFSGTLQGHSGSMFYYLLMVPLLLLPWLAWLLAALRRVWSDRSDPLHRFLWVWCLFVVAFFSLSGTKLPHYALYGCTPLFLLSAAQIDRVRNSLLAGLPIVAMIALWVALPKVFQQASAHGWVADAYYRLQIARSEAALPGGYRVAGWVALALAVAVLCWRPWPRTWPRTWPRSWPRSWPLWQRAVVAAGLNTLLLGGMVAPYVGDVLEGPVKRAALFARSLSDPAVLWNFHMPSFSVYRQRVTPLRAPRPGELALTRVDRLPNNENSGAPRETLYREGGVVLVRAAPAAAASNPPR